MELWASASCLTLYKSPDSKIKLSEEPDVTVGVGWGIKTHHRHLSLSLVPRIFPHGCVPGLEH